MTTSRAEVLVILKSKPHTTLPQQPLTSLLVSVTFRACFQQGLRSIPSTQHRWPMDVSSTSSPLSLLSLLNIHRYVLVTVLNAGKEVVMGVCKIVNEWDMAPSTYHSAAWRNKICTLKNLSDSRAVWCIKCQWDVVASRKSQFQRRESARKNHGLGWGWGKPSILPSTPPFSMFRHQCLASWLPILHPLPNSEGSRTEVSCGNACYVPLDQALIRMLMKVEWISQEVEPPAAPPPQI